MISRLRRSIKKGGRPPKKSAVESPKKSAVEAPKQLNLHAMTTSELRALAQELGVNVAASMKSAQIIKKIEEARSKPSAVEKVALPTYGVPAPPPPPPAMSKQHMADSGVAALVGKDGSLCLGLSQKDCTGNAVMKKTCQWMPNAKPVPRCQRKANTTVFGEEGKKAMSNIEADEKKWAAQARDQYVEEKRAAASDDSESVESESVESESVESELVQPKKSAKKTGPKKASSKKGKRAAVKPARPSSCGLNAKKSHCVSGVLPNDDEHCTVNEATNRCNKVKAPK
jgi:hypothetical protein